MGGQHSEVFISYAWGGESERIAAQIEGELIARGIRLIRDKKDLPYGGSVREFMKRIGEGRAVVAVISDKYLKSKHCMFELVEVFKHRSFAERIFPIVLGDARIYDAAERLDYVLHWDEKIDELDRKIRQVDRLTNLQGFREELDLFAEIRATIGRLTDILQDLNALSPEIHREGDFEDLSRRIESTLGTGSEPNRRAAATRLAALPLDEIPKRGALPPGSRMPLRPNPLFVGREGDFRRLARLLKAGDTAAVGEVEIAAATGLGGVGKTQLACELVHRYGRFFAGGVFWLSFADPDAVPAEIAACGLGLAGSGFRDLPIAEQVRAVTDVWQSPLPRLLVFDNCEDPELLERWRPKSGGARVLVTSRRASWDLASGVKTVALGTLPRDTSVALLTRFRPDFEGHRDLDEVADELGDLPLALHLAGSFLKRYRHAPFGQPAAYLSQLRQDNLLRHPSFAGRENAVSPTGHKQHVARTFALSFERLDAGNKTDNLARSLLARAVWFAPGEPIPRRLLLASAGFSVGDLAAGLRAEDALARLIELGLAEAEADGAVRIHRLVAAFVRDIGNEAGTRDAVEQAVIDEADRLNRSGLPKPVLLWQSHLRAITDGARRCQGATAASLCNALGLHLNMIGDLAGARPYFERALAIREEVLEPDHPRPR